MCKRSKPKYKVGDIMEWWGTGKEPLCHKLLIVNITKQTLDTYQYWDKRLQKRNNKTRKIYTTKVNTYEYEMKQLDMQRDNWKVDSYLVETKHIFKSCGWGWRKIA